MAMISNAWGDPTSFATIKSGFPVDVIGSVHSSPNLADLDGDGNPEIIVGTGSGYVYVIDSAGTILARYNTGVPIESSPSVGDINNDGQLEIVVSTGSYACDFTCHAAVYAFDKDLNVLPGWPQYSIDFYESGYHPGFHATPALGDLDKDGDLEIVVAGFDQYLHVWHHDGTYMENWPRWTYETQSSSAALADIDKDGYLEIIIGIEAHEWNPIWPPGEEEPDTPTLDGGYIYVLDRFAVNKPGFPQYIDQIIQSSPAVGDINNDGELEIVVGTGAFYPGVGYGIYAYDKNGIQLWKVNTSNWVFSSPALGDIDGDGGLDVAIWSQDGYIYALDGATGHALSGWPVKGQDSWGRNYYSQGISPALADYDGDGRADIFISLGWEVVIVKSDGTFITNDGNHDNDPNHPNFYANGTTSPATPAVNDLDGDNLLNVVVGSLDVDSGEGKVYAWETGKTVSVLPWPMFHKNESHSGRFFDENLVGQFVTRFYQQCLNRLPDQTGLNTWVKDLVGGTRTGAEIAKGFVLSPEFINRGTTNAQFITILYSAFFNRAPDASGYNSWLAQLDSGTRRAEVLNGFIYAQEFNNLCGEYGITAYTAADATRALVEAFVARFYQQCLNREPDSVGLDSWVSNLLAGSTTGAELAYNFVFSQEFVERGTSNEQYLTVLYRAFFNREPDSGGYSLWLSQLESGTSRLEVLQGFTGAQEFFALCAQYGIEPQ